MKNFKELLIWQKGISIATKCFDLTSIFPKEEKYGISSQITRSGVSIPSNIAEGSSRTSEKDYSRFIEIALGSAFELETQLIIAKNVKFGTTSLIIEILDEITEIQKMLHSFKSKLNK